MAAITAKEWEQRRDIARRAAWEVEEWVQILEVLPGLESDCDRARATICRRLSKLAGVIMSSNDDDDTVDNLEKRLSDEVTA